MSPRSNTNTPFSNLNSASSAAAPSSATSQGGGGGGGVGGGVLGGSSGVGGSIRSGNFGISSSSGITSPTVSAFDRNTFGSGASGGGSSNQSSVLKISITQLILLLNSITEKEGKAKWESQADAIRKVSHVHNFSRLLMSIEFFFLQLEFG